MMANGDRTSSSSDARVPLLRSAVTVLLVLFLLKPMIGCNKTKVSAEAPPPEVEVASVIQEDIPIYSEYVATLDGYVNAQIQPQVTGYLLKQVYREGSEIHTGDVLFEIDPRPFQAALAEAQGQLAGAQAQLGKTQLDVARDTPLAKESAIPQAQLDNDIQANRAATAQVAAANAQVEQAKLNVGFTNIRSLVDGVAGLAKGQIGDLVGPTTVLTTVSQIEPIKAYFSISEQEYLKFADRISAFREGRSAPSGRRILDLILSDGTIYSGKGWVVLADRQVDVKTGTIRMAGAFDNPRGILRPGMFGRVRAATDIAKGALLVPQRAVMETQGSYSVVVVSSDKRVSIRPVKTGERVGELWIITDGLQAGEQVVAEGMQKAKAGAIVQPKQFKQITPGE